MKLSIVCRGFFPTSLNNLNLQVIQDNNNPEWNEFFQINVDSLELCSLSIKVFDEDDAVRC
jgi:Ca2+-dependent lipid-binding protein